MLLCYYVIMSLCYYVIMLLCHYVIMLLCYYVIMSLCYYAIMLLRYYAITLYVVCYMLYAICYMFYVKCYTLHVLGFIMTISYVTRHCMAGERQPQIHSGEFCCRAGHHPELTGFEGSPFTPRTALALHTPGWPSPALPLPNPPDSPSHQNPFPHCES